MIWVGTSGYAYQDWHGPFYPAGLPAGERLAYYAREFRCVEINSSFYRQPSAAQSARVASKAPPDFRFAVKVYGGLTHDHLAATRADFRTFQRGLEPYRERGVLAAVLAQFPNAFRPGPDTEAHLRRLREEWPELPLAVELRHGDWAAERTERLLRELAIAWCGVDEPDLPGLMPRSLSITATIAYARFHGRNASHWYRHDQAWERYDYRYRPDELKEWLPRLKRAASETDDVYVFFNNHYEAQAVLDARELARQLGLGSVGDGGTEEITEG